MERLTYKHWRNLDPWECCGQDNYCKRGCHDDGGCNNGCIVPKLYDRLAKYEDTGLTPEEIRELTHDSTGQLHKKLGQFIDAERDERLMIFPCKVGTELFVIWLGKIVKGDVIGFHFHEWSNGSYVRVLFDTKKLNGARDFSLDSFGKTLFFSKEEAEAFLKGEHNAN